MTSPMVLLALQLASSRHNAASSAAGFWSGMLVGLGCFDWLLNSYWSLFRPQSHILIPFVCDACLPCLPMRNEFCVSLEKRKSFFIAVFQFSCFQMPSNWKWVSWEKKEKRFFHCYFRFFLFPNASDFGRHVSGLS